MHSLAESYGINILTSTGALSSGCLTLALIEDTLGAVIKIGRKLMNFDQNLSMPNLHWRDLPLPLHFGPRWQSVPIQRLNVFHLSLPFLSHETSHLAAPSNINMQLQ